METLILYGSIAGALTAIIVLLKKVLDDVINPLKEILREWKEDQDFANYSRMCSLRLFIQNEDIPLEERIEAWEKYVAHGWNGFTKSYGLMLKERQAEIAKSKAKETI